MFEKMHKKPKLRSGVVPKKGDTRRDRSAQRAAKRNHD